MRRFRYIRWYYLLGMVFVLGYAIFLFDRIFINHFVTLKRHPISDRLPSDLDRVAFNSDNTRIAIAPYKRQIALFSLDAEGDQEPFLIPDIQGMHSRDCQINFEFSPVDPNLFFVGEGRISQIWDITKRQLIRTIHVPESFGTTRWHFSQDGRCLIRMGINEIELFDIQNETSRKIEIKNDLDESVKFHFSHSLQHLQTDRLLLLGGTSIEQNGISSFSSSYPTVCAIIRYSTGKVIEVGLFNVSDSPDHVMLDEARDWMILSLPDRRKPVILKLPGENRRFEEIKFPFQERFDRYESRLRHSQCIADTNLLLYESGLYVRIVDLESNRIETILEFDEKDNNKFIFTRAKASRDGRLLFRLVSPPELFQVIPNPDYAAKDRK